MLARALELAATVRDEWGMPLFVAVSYTFSCLFTISYVRAIRLDRQYRQKAKPSRLRIRAYAFVIAAPTEFLIGYLWGIALDSAAAHAVAAGLFAPVIADLWIRILYWRGCHEQAEIFKIGKRRRATDSPLDDTGETRL